MAIDLTTKGNIFEKITSAEQTKLNILYEQLKRVWNRNLQRAEHHFESEISRVGVRRSRERPRMEDYGRKN